ncbi:aspartate kinase [Parvularcula lutaonensis]|uniref:Aspartokinase n=1 Tax=Parvularcula lutaonensis TaxID=491923 RepID=A0ABV7MEB5_9PROT
MKFGGTSVGDPERIARVARHVMAARKQGFKVCVTVSAMAGETNRLVALTEELGGGDVSRDPDYDAVVASGEQVTAGLLALHLRSKGCPARSFQGWQMGLETDDSHGAAKIKRLPQDRLMDAMENGEVAVVAGFQGFTAQGRISTLGRGGSDTTAVALAAALGAARCDIYTDVDGVYTTDPRIVATARRKPVLAYEEMLEMASVGAKVLQTRSVGLAMTYGVPVRVLSSLQEPEETGEGTLITGEDEIMEHEVVTAVVPSVGEAKISLLGVPDKPGYSALIFRLLSEAGVNIDMIVQSPARQGSEANMSFTLSEKDLSFAMEKLTLAKDELGYDELVANQNVAKVSVIGIGMKTHTGVAAKMFETLADKAINIENISTSEIKISVLIAADYTELAVRALHEAFGLSSQDA